MRKPNRVVIKILCGMKVYRGTPRRKIIKNLRKMLRRQKNYQIKKHIFIKRKKKIIH